MEPPRPPPDLLPELIEEILIRLPPAHPACLVRASLVCKPWRRVVCDAAFRRRYLAFHRAPPPLLGFLHNRYPNIRGYCLGPRLVSTTTPSPLPPHAFDHYFFHRWRVLDCRHGRVLLKDDNIATVNLVVWDTVTGEQKRLPEPPVSFLHVLDYTAAVLCAVRGCDHLDCHGGPFIVVFVDYDVHFRAMALQTRKYSSEARTWSSSPNQFPDFIPVHKPSVLIGDDVYFVVAAFPSVAVLKVGLEENHLSIIDQPEAAQHDIEKNVVLMAMGDGLLGFAGIQGSTLCMWSRNVNPEVDGGWVLCRFIELQPLIPFRIRLLVVGSAEGYGIIFVATDVGVFSLELKSSNVMKVDEPQGDFSVFPFMSFYTPDGSSSKKFCWIH